MVQNPQQKSVYSQTFQSKNKNCNSKAIVKKQNMLIFKHLAKIKVELLLYGECSTVWAEKVFTLSTKLDAIAHYFTVNKVIEH